LSINRGAESEKGVGNSRDKRKNEACRDTKPKSKPMDVSGSSKSLRGVGLIQVFQDLDLTAINQAEVNQD
jgi:hypothetical protein